MEEYRVNLDIYNGPLDLLLYLIRREEVDIYDIPISRLTEQYLKYVEVIHQLDPNMAGEFLVMAATLLEVKTRMLLPSVPSEEGGPAEAADTGLDPRTELVRQLLEYKAFKDAAMDLQDAGVQQAMRFPRKPNLPQFDPTELDMEDVQVWDLVEAFSKIMESIGQRPTHHEVIYDDTPLELHADDIVDRLGREGGMTFRRIFEGRDRRSEMIGLFLAVLELVRQKRIVARQDSNFGEIYVELNANPPAADGSAGASDAAAPAQQAAVSSDEPADSAPPAGAEDDDADAEVAAAPDAPAASAADADAAAPQDLGRYIADSPSPPKENEDEHRAEDSGSGV